MERKKFLKRLSALSLAGLLCVSTAGSALASTIEIQSDNEGSVVTLDVKDTSTEPEIINVSVPAEIPLVMDETGALTVGDGLLIANKSADHDVRVSAINVQGDNGWSISDFSTDLSTEPENTKKLSMAFNGDGTQDGGQVSLTPDAWCIAAEGQIDLDVDAKMPRQTADSQAAKTNIAVVGYTFEVTDEAGGGPAEEPEEGTIQNDWDESKLLLANGSRNVNLSWSSNKETASITDVSVKDDGIATVEKASTAAVNTLDYSGSEAWTVRGVAVGTTTVTATLSSGETTEFDVTVGNLTGSDDNASVSDDNVTGTDGLQPGDDLGDGSHNITVNVPVTTPEGDGTITVTPEFPEDTVLEEGENNIAVDVIVDGVTIHLTITINIAVNNPSDGLTQSVEDAQAMGFTFSSYEDGLQIDSFENKQFKSEVNVPEQIGDFKVLKIGNHAFRGQTNLKKITLPSSIVELGSGCFWGCYNAAIYFSAESTQIKHFRSYYMSPHSDGYVEGVTVQDLGQPVLFGNVASVHLSNLSILSDDAILQLLYTHYVNSTQIYINEVKKEFGEEYVSMKYTGNDYAFLTADEAKRTVFAFALDVSGNLIDLSDCNVALGNLYANYTAKIDATKSMYNEQIDRIYIGIDGYMVSKIHKSSGTCSIYLNDTLYKQITKNSK